MYIGIPAVAQWDQRRHLCSTRTPVWLKDAVVGGNYSSDLIRGPGTPYAEGQPKKEKKNLNSLYV